jgi:predicted RecA/RadA family phage recombinase
VSNTAQIVNAGAIFVAEGTTIDFIPDANVAAGSVVVVGKLVGIAKFGIQAGTRGNITVRGVFDVVKDPRTNIPTGTILYWSQISCHIVKNAYAHPMIGKAIENAPPSSLTVRLRLNQQPLRDL